MKLNLLKGFALLGIISLIGLSIVSANSLEIAAGAYMGYIDSKNPDALYPLWILGDAGTVGTGIAYCGLAYAAAGVGVAAAPAVVALAAIGITL
jgi:hypothetical protein